MNPPPAEGLAARLFLAPTLRTQSDRRLVTLVREGYEAAFEEIVRRYGQALRGYAAAIVGGRCEDVTQDAFSKALLALRRDSEAEIELRPWLYRIVRNTALNDLRDRPPDAAELNEAIAGGSRSAAEEVERREEVAELLRRLRTLPEPQRAAIVMRELEGLGHEEIAAALGMSGGAARQAIYRARTALRDGLGLLVPLPLVRVLLEHGAEATAATAGAGGAAVAASGALGGAGASGALKIGIATAVVAGTVGTGVAINENRNREPQADAAPATTREAAASAASPATADGIPAGAASTRAGTGGGTAGGGGDPGLGGSLATGGDGSGSGVPGGGRAEEEGDRPPRRSPGPRHGDGPIRQGHGPGGRHGGRGPKPGGGHGDIGAPVRDGRGPGAGGGPGPSGPGPRGDGEGPGGGDGPGDREGEAPPEGDPLGEEGSGPGPAGPRPPRDGSRSSGDGAGGGEELP